jgi:uncharacterized protein (DUF2147 family)
LRRGEAFKGIFEPPIRAFNNGCDEFQGNGTTGARDKARQVFTGFSADEWNIGVTYSMSNYYQKALSGSGIKLSARNRAQENQKLEAVSLAIVTLFTAAMTSGAALAAEPTGDWQVEDGSAVIRVEDCRGALWGVVAWERVPGRDERSGRPTLGSAVLINMRASSQTRWDGQIQCAERPDL